MWRRLAGPALVLGAVLAWRAGVLLGLDLHDVPGAPGAQVLASALTENAPGWESRVLAAWLSALPLAPRFATHLLMALAGLVSVGGAALGGHALADRRGAMAAALVAAAWSQTTFVSMLVGADALAAGLTWLGLGLAWQGARTGFGGLVLGGVGTFVVAVGLGFKMTAVPAVPLLLAAPLLGRRTLVGPVSTALGLTAGAMAGWAFLAAHYRLPPAGGGMAAAGLQPVLEGWARLLTLRSHAGHDGALPLLALLALLGILLPGARPRHGWRVGLLTALALGMTVSSLGDHLRPRYLVAASYGLVVLVGAGLARSVHLARPLRLARHLPAGLVILFLVLDALAFFETWSQRRVRWAGTAPSSWISAPARFTARYRQMPFDTSTSAVGSAPLLELGEQAPAGGVAGIHLRDRRESHLELGAALVRRPARILWSRRCCGEETASASCATEVVQDLGRAGAVLVLPRLEEPGPQGVTRVDDRIRSWGDALAKAAEEAVTTGVLSPEPEKGGAWWRVWRGQGSAGPLPCGPRRRGDAGYGPRGGAPPGGRIPGGPG